MSSIPGTRAPVQPRVKQIPDKTLLPFLPQNNRLSNVVEPYITSENTLIYRSKDPHTQNMIGIFTALENYWNPAFFPRSDSDLSRFVFQTQCFTDAKAFYDASINNGENAPSPEQRHILWELHSLIMHTFFEHRYENSAVTKSIQEKFDYLMFSPARQRETRQDYTAWIRESEVLVEYRHRKRHIDAFGNFMKVKEGLYQHVLADCIVSALEGFFGTVVLPFWVRVLEDFKRASQQSFNLTNSQENKLDSQNDVVQRVCDLEPGLSTVFFGFFNPKTFDLSDGRRVNISGSHAFVARFYKFNDQSYGMSLQNFGLGQMDSYRPTAHKNDKKNILKGPIFFHYGSDLNHIERTVQFLIDYSRNQHGSEFFGREFCTVVKKGEAFIEEGRRFALLPGYEFLRDATFFYEDTPGGFCTSLSMCADLKQVLGQYMHSDPATRHPIAGEAAYLAMEFSIIEYFKENVTRPYIDLFPNLSQKADQRMEFIKTKLTEYKDKHAHILDVIPEPFHSKIRNIPDPTPPAAPVVIPVVHDSSCNCTVS